MFRRISFGLLIMLLMPLGLRAQITTTTIFGSVTDRSGSAIAGAQVTAVNTDTGLLHTVTANAEGEYRITLLPVGHYMVKTSAPGFEQSVQQNIVLTINQTALVNVTLNVGSVNQTVSVTAAPPMINTSNSTIGQTVENVEITNLPIVGRNVFTLLTITPGVQSSQNSIVFGYPEQRTMINGGVNGGSGSVTYYMDGGLNMTGLRNTGNILPNPDAIQEFRVETNNYNAAFGRSSAGVINALTKSGTNEFHGSAFEFVQNRIFNANTWGNKGATPVVHRNQFGGTIGGPIRRDKAFFFFTYGGLRQTTPNFESGVTVPTAAERTGDFSADAPIRDPYVLGLPQFTGNQIPSGLMDPTAMNIINKYIPLPNTVNPKTGLMTFWDGFAPPSPYNSNEYLGKVDELLTHTQRLTGEYYITSGYNILPSSSGIPWARRRFFWRQQNVNGSHTWTVNPHTVNQAWVNYTRNMAGRVGLPATSLGDLGSQFQIQGTPSLPSIGVSGYFTLGQGITGPQAGTNFIGVRDLLDINKGLHSFNFGGELSFERDIQETLLDNFGVFNFTKANTGNALADFELGLPDSVEQDQPVTPITSDWYFALFAQDDYRILPRLVLNLGLRWDLQTPPVDAHNLMSTFIEGRQSTIRPDAPLGLLFPGDSGIPRGIVPVEKSHFSPRVGFSWDPFGDGKTSVRGGFGMFYGSVSGNEWNGSSNYEPFATRLSFVNIVTATPTAPLGPNNIGATLTDPYQNYPGGIPFPYKGTFTPGGGVAGQAPNFQWPVAYQTNLTVEKQLGKSFSLSTSYIGALGRRLPFATDLNYPVLNVPGVIPTTGNAPLRRPIDNPNLGFEPGSAFGQVYSTESNQATSYNAFQVSVLGKLQRDLTLRAWYTFSKSIESIELTNDTNSPTPQDYNNLSEERGRSENDMRHMFSASFVWEPIYYHGTRTVLHALLNGWEVTGIVTLDSGEPFSLETGEDNNLDGISSNDRPDLVPGVNPALDPHRSRPVAVKEWFNTAAFVPNAVGTDGNSGRNILDLPGYKNVNLGIFRNITFRDRYKLQIRAESTNAFNWVNLNSPGETLTSSSFGVITSAGAMRTIQLGARLVF